MTSSGHNKVAIGETIIVTGVLLNGLTTGVRRHLCHYGVYWYGERSHEFSYALATTPATGTYSFTSSSIKDPTYVNYFDVGGNNEIDVGDTLSQSAFFANAFGSTTFAGIGHYGTKTLNP